MRNTPGCGLKEIPARDYLTLFVYLNEMNEFDKLLRQLASRSSAEVPGNLEATVWREIRRRQRSLPESLGARIASSLWQWQCAAVALVAALLFGGGFAAFRYEMSDERSVTQAVHLEVFSEHSPTLLLNGLYERL